MNNNNNTPLSITHNCNCLEIMKTMADKSVDLAICDPPYLTEEEQTGTIRTRGNVQSKLTLGGQPNEEIFNEIFRISKNQIIFGANNFKYPFQGFIVWEKTNIPDNFTLSKCEIASLNKELSRTSKIIRLSSASTKTEPRIHQTQKPIQLYTWIFNNYTKENDLIFDPFLGSQSSRIAAYELNRNFIGCEINEDFYKLGNKRFNDYIKQLRLF